MTIETIRTILGDRQLLSVATGTTLRDAARTMAEHSVGAVAVIEGGELVGVLSERDIVFKGVGAGLPSATATVGDVMTRDPVTVQIDDPISNALATKLGNKFRHLPVMDGTTCIGVISYREIPAQYVMMFERFHEMSTAHADDGA